MHTHLSLQQSRLMMLPRGLKAPESARGSRKFHIIVTGTSPSPLPACRAHTWEGADPAAYGVVFRYAKDRERPSLCERSWARRKLLATPSFQAGVVAFKNDDSMMVASSLVNAGHCLYRDIWQPAIMPRQ